MEIPSHWSWARFAAVAAIQSDLVDTKKYAKAPHIAPDNIQSWTGELLPYELIGTSGVFSSKHLFFPGAILYSKIRPALAKAVVVDLEGPPQGAIGAPLQGGALMRGEGRFEAPLFKQGDLAQLRKVRDRFAEDPSARRTKDGRIGHGVPSTHPGKWSDHYKPRPIRAPKGGRSTPTTPSKDRRDEKK